MFDEMGVTWLAGTAIHLPEAMMVRRDLRGNTEPLENESRTEVERWRIEPEGEVPPEAESGLIRLAKRSASVLYSRGNLHARWGIQLGDTVSPCVSPLYPPYAGIRWLHGGRDVVRSERSSGPQRKRESHLPSDVLA
jgi:hypothetical protein